MGKLDGGDTLTIGLDYYYLWPGSPHFDSGINTTRLENDDVITVKVWKLNNSIACKEYLN
jgi:hypothetical protein